MPILAISASFRILNFRKTDRWNLGTSQEGKERSVAFPSFKYCIRFYRDCFKFLVHLLCEFSLSLSLRYHV